MSFILGISGYFHDSSVCLSDENGIVDFVREEALTRIKGNNQFPFRAISYMRSHYSLNDANINAVVFYEKPLRGWASGIFHSLNRPRQSFPLLKSQLKQFWTGPIGVHSEIQKSLKITSDKVFYAPHHLSHALSAHAYIPINKSFEPSLNFVFDGVGDGNTISIFLFEGGKYHLFHQQFFPFSIGLFYSAMADFCGFVVNEGEYKFMALAAHGDPTFIDFFSNDIVAYDEPIITLNMKYFDFDKSPERSFSRDLIEKLGEPISQTDLQNPASENFQRAANIASTTQSIVEQLLVKIVSWATNKTGITNISVSGGVAQNCVAMAKIAQLKNLSAFTVPPSPGDSGAALGAASFGRMLRGWTPLSIQNLAFGKANLTVKKQINKFLFKKTAGKDSLARSADLLKRGEIICVFMNKKEVGPRALGYRSIICSAKHPRTVKKLNEEVKKREFFRPLAPVMLPKLASQFFDIPPIAQHNFRWMGLTAKENLIPKSYRSILHLNKSSRLQIVNDKENTLYRLLKILEGDIDVLVNTSFNVAGDPIVHDLVDCYTNMRRLGIKFLLTQNSLLEINEVEQ